MKNNHPTESSNYDKAKKINEDMGKMIAEMTDEAGLALLESSNDWDELKRQCKIRNLPYTEVKYIVESLLQAREDRINELEEEVSRLQSGDDVAEYFLFPKGK